MKGFTIHFFGYLRLSVHDIVAKYTISEESTKSLCMPARKIHSRTPAIIERAQGLISVEAGISLWKLKSY